MSLIRMLILAAVFAAATYFFGWVTVPCIGAVYALLRRRYAAPGESGLAVILAWGALLGVTAMQPAFATLIARLTVLFKMPGVIVVLLTLVFGVGLAWSAARLVTAVVVRPGDFQAGRVDKKRYE